MSLGVKATHALFGLILQLFFSGFVFWLRFSRESLIWFKVFSAFLSLFSPVLFFSFNIRLLTSFFPLQTNVTHWLTNPNWGIKPEENILYSSARKRNKKNLFQKSNQFCFLFKKEIFHFKIEIFFQLIEEKKFQRFFFLDQTKKQSSCCVCARGLIFEDLYLFYNFVFLGLEKKC